MGCYFGFYFIFIFGFNVESLNLGLVCFKKGKRKKHLVGESSILLFNKMKK